MDTVQTKIFDRIRSSGPGRVFTPKDFLDLGSRDATDQILSRLVRNGDIQRLARGLYYYPRINARFGVSIAPDMDQVADALGRQTGSRVVPSGAVAANRLGLSTQVPAKPVYLTDGRSRQVKVGDTVFHIKHAAPKDLPMGGPTSAIIFQALRHMGKDAVNSRMISTIRRTLSAKQRKELLQDSRYATDWISQTVRQIVQESVRETVHG